jgi:hypothetical protein
MTSGFQQVNSALLTIQAMKALRKLESVFLYREVIFFSLLFHPDINSMISDTLVFSVPVSLFQRASS